MIKSGLPEYIASFASKKAGNIWEIYQKICTVSRVDKVCLVKLKSVLAKIYLSCLDLSGLAFFAAVLVIFMPLKLWSSFSRWETATLEIHKNSRVATASLSPLMSCFEWRSSSIFPGRSPFEVIAIH